MVQAAECLYKTTKVKVGGWSNVQVPRESVYDSEFIRILANWFQQGQYMITSQWHHVVKSSHRYSNIIISSGDGKSLVVIELLATECSRSIREHIKRTKEYKENLRAGEAWVVHFTRQDYYLQDPQWQCDQLFGDINVVHIWHNREFTEVCMIARGNNSESSIERII